MTTIAAVQGDGWCVLCADSQITEDNLRTISTRTPKIVAIGDYLIGITGDARPGDILAYNWTPPTYTGDDKITFMGKKLIPSMIRAFETHGTTGLSKTKMVALITSLPLTVNYSTSLAI